MRLCPHLTSLTRLFVLGNENELLSWIPPHISTMASLQKLRLEAAGPITAASLPGIERLTALEHLTLSYCDLEPPCLLHMTTGLTRLCLHHVFLQPRQAQQDGAFGASQLLQVLARLCALRELSMDSIIGDWPQQQLALYSALTASSNLQQHHTNSSSIPGAALVHAFPAGRTLPNLHLFGLRRYHHGPAAAADSTAIACLVSCCPALRDVNIIATCVNASLAPLQSLTALTHLTIGPVSPAVIRSDLIALSQLRGLEVLSPLPGAGAGVDASHELQHLVPLTAPTGLTGLYSRGVWLPSKAPAGAPPNVWVQLLEKCATDQAAQPAVISSVVRQLQQQQQDTQELRGQLEAAGAESAELRGRVQAAEGRVLALEEQLQEVLTALKQQQ